MSETKTKDQTLYVGGNPMAQNFFFDSRSALLLLLSACGKQLDGGGTTAAAPATPTCSSSLVGEFENPKATMELKECSALFVEGEIGCVFTGDLAGKEGNAGTVSVKSEHVGAGCGSAPEKFDCDYLLAGDDLRVSCPEIKLTIDFTRKK